MITLGQVVAAMAAGALLILALVLVVDRHYKQRETEQTIETQEAERDDEEWLIEATRQITVDTFEALQRDESEDLPAPPAGVGSYELPRGAVVMRSKGHLRLISGAVAALVTAGTAARDAVRQHRGLTTAAVGTVATAAAITTLTLTPWGPDNDANPEKPTAAPPATGQPSPTTTGSSTSPTGTPTAPGTSASPPPGTAAGMAPALEGMPNASLPAGESPPAGTPTPTNPEASSPPGDGGTGPAPPPSTKPPHHAPPPQASVGRLCLDVDVPSLRDVDVCLLPGS